MEMKEIVKAVLSLALLVSVFFFLRRPVGPLKPVVAILQIASHPALDAARCGFVDAFTAGIGGGYTFLVKNADGSVANAQAIAQSLASRSDVVAFFALGTPAAQALVQKESVKPIFFTAVTYPEKSGIAQSNVAGISDYFDLKDLVEFAHNVVPKALRMGILYNPGSDVASQEIQEIEHACKHHGLVPVRIAGVTEADILGALKSSIRKIDICVAPTDNTIASVMSALAEMCKDSHVPLIVADKTLVKSGPLAGLGMDYADLGVRVGMIAADVLQGKLLVHERGIMRATPEFAFNKSTQDALLGGDCVLNCSCVSSEK